MFGLFFFFFLNFKHILKNAEERLAVSGFLEGGFDDERFFVFFYMI